MNKMRLVVDKGLSPSGRLEYTFYDTGSLAVSEVGAPLMRSKNGDGGYLRFNNLREFHKNKKLPLLIRKLDELGPLKHPTLVDYAESHHRDILNGYLAFKTNEPLLAFAALSSGVREVRNYLNFEEIFSRVSANKVLIQRAFELNTLEFMMRGDLGFFSGDISKLGRGASEFEANLKTLAARSSTPGYKLLQERLASGERLRADLVAEKSGFNRYSMWQHESSRVLDSLTEEEFGWVADIYSLRKEYKSMAGLSFELTFLFAYALITHGEERAREFFRWLVEEHNRDNNSTWGTITLKSISSDPEEPFTYEVLAEALDNLDVPVSFAVLLV